ncbi:hypothetical protein CONPUDRAFT_72038 [Coniophora puteana RWD-64-598 SS2]|uniref:Uncharacterized protein n=1 Tax=Coniophora puteana (strain RWD-64-598) TaxID=741705 RepID=A0A5M3MWG7_CONPW|nr:uncharacterized protein CONPUDRAFT_72038 [Coniophora puteana RWD-64-598 SS2]EIW83498.1 hypothetical protein CONPUDRAFT_72038 [Coniophora puteana RWD-64-598 SS2]
MRGWAIGMGNRGARMKDKPPSRQQGRLASPGIDDASTCLKKTLEEFQGPLATTLYDVELKNDLQTPFRIEESALALSPGTTGRVAGLEKPRCARRQGSTWGTGREARHEGGRRERIELSSTCVTRDGWYYREEGRKKREVREQKKMLPRKHSGSWARMRATRSRGEDRGFRTMFVVGSFGCVGETPTQTEYSSPSWSPTDIDRASAVKKVRGRGSVVQVVASSTTIAVAIVELGTSRIHLRRLLALAPIRKVSMRTYPPFGNDQAR